MRLRALTFSAARAGACQAGLALAGGAAKELTFNSDSRLNGSPPRSAATCLRWRSERVDVDAADDDYSLVWMGSVCSTDQALHRRTCCGSAALWLLCSRRKALTLLE